jgi:hypothetical protein
MLQVPARLAVAVHYASFLAAPAFLAVFSVMHGGDNIPANRAALPVIR